jgi:signal peptidase I
MPVTVQLLSGETYSYDIFDNYRIRNLENELLDTLYHLGYRMDNAVFSTRDENGDFSRCEDLDLVNDGDHFYAVVNDAPTSIDMYIDFDGDTVYLTDDDSTIYRYYGYEYGSNGQGALEIPERVNLIVRLPREGYVVMAEDIAKELADMDDEVEEFDIERVIYNSRADRLNFFNQYYNLFINLPGKLVSISFDGERQLELAMTAMPKRSLKGNIY